MVGICEHGNEPSGSQNARSLGLDKELVNFQE